MPLSTAAGHASVRVGNLRQRALDAAHRILERDGEAGLSLRAIAADLGAGVGSLYHHFAGKDALLAELAADGFRELGERMGAEPRARPHQTMFRACGEAYLGFTRHRPALYAIMYNERILAAYPIAREAEREALAVLRRSLEGAGVAAVEAEDVALAFWALGRGMASISAGMDPRAPGAGRAIVRSVIKGLEGLIGGAAGALDLYRRD